MILSLIIVIYFNYQNEIPKILIKSKNFNILPFEYNKKGNIFINSKMRFNFDKNKFDLSLPYRTCELKDYDMIITNATDMMVEPYKELGFNIINK